MDVNGKGHGYFKELKCVYFVTSVALLSLIYLLIHLTIHATFNLEKLYKLLIYYGGVMKTKN